jgi:hypothetical protein
MLRQVVVAISFHTLSQSWSSNTPWFSSRTWPLAGSCSGGIHREKDQLAYCQLISYHRNESEVDKDNASCFLTFDPNGDGFLSRWKQGPMCRKTRRDDAMHDWGGQDRVDLFPA